MVSNNGRIYLEWVLVIESRLVKNLQSYVSEILKKNFFNKLHLMTLSWLSLKVFFKPIQILKKNFLNNQN